MTQTIPSPESVDILVVDDTPDNIRFLSALLTEQGYRVRKALNGTMALTAVQALPPDLILLDITMPDMNGFEVCQQLKDDPKTAAIPVIFLSALDQVVDKVKAFQVGGIDYITKPFQFEEVIARIQTQLTIRHLQTQLQQKNETLQQALHDLSKAQVHLVQREKMAGLGQLMAGIAHEINNPINFISANLQPASGYIEDILTLINLYQQECPTPSEHLRQAIEQTDLEFVIPDLKKLMSSIRTGADRIGAIVLACRVFSRLDESEIKSVNIHDGIDSTLLLLQHRLQQDHFTIEVIKQYEDIPLITCYASQMNQVMFHLINNAIDALEQKMESDRNSKMTDVHPYRIWITTRMSTPKTLAIQIKDNGLGLPEQVQTSVFNPFYTTKPVGQGMGLGLSISYQIVVEKHNGQLSYQSDPMGETAFMVEIPIDRDLPSF